MATDKRDRQRSNRAEKQAVERKAQSRKQTFDRIKRWGLYGLLIAGGIIAINIFLG